MPSRSPLLFGLLIAALTVSGCGRRDADTAAAGSEPVAYGTVSPETPSANAVAPDSDSLTQAVRKGGSDASDLPRLGTAPAWQLTRIDGTPFGSKDLEGKVVVVDFWATWCGPCRVEIPGYVEMQKQYADEGLVIVGVSLDQQGPGVVRQFADNFEINYPLVMADQQVIGAFGGIEAIPTTFLIDRDGQIRHRKVGAMEREQYEPLVRSLL